MPLFSYSNKYNNSMYRWDASFGSDIIMSLNSTIPSIY